MVQFISIADCEFLDEPDPTARITENIPRTKVITIRLTEDEREMLHLKSLSEKISLNNYVRDKLGLPARIRSQEKSAGAGVRRSENENSGIGYMMVSCAMTSSAF